MERLAAILVFLMVTTMTVSGQARQDDARLNALCDRLKATQTEQEARLVEALIWQLWFQSGSRSIDRMLERGNVAMNQGRYPEALALFNGVVETDPNLAEG